MNNLLDQDGNPVDLDAIEFDKVLKRPVMTREEWNTYIQAAPITLNQLGTIMHKFHELNFSKSSERPWYLTPDDEWFGRTERLDIISWLIGRDVSSTYDLTQAEAGKLILLLKDITTRDYLLSLLPDEYWSEGTDDTFRWEDTDKDERGKKWIGIALIVCGLVLAFA